MKKNKNTHRFFLLALLWVLMACKEQEQQPSIEGVWSYANPTRDGRIAVFKEEGRGYTMDKDSSHVLKFIYKTYDSKCPIWIDIEERSWFVNRRYLGIMRFKDQSTLELMTDSIRPKKFDTTSLHYLKFLRQPEQKL